jgi:hypothetical protein
MDTETSSRAGKDGGEDGSKDGGKDELNVQAFLELVRTAISAAPQTGTGPAAAARLRGQLTLLHGLPARAVVYCFLTVQTLGSMLQRLGAAKQMVDLCIGDRDAPARIEDGLMECVHVAHRVASAYGLDVGAAAPSKLPGSVGVLLDLRDALNAAAELTANVDWAAAFRSFGVNVCGWSEASSLPADILCQLLTDTSMWQVTLIDGLAVVELPHGLFVANLPPASLVQIHGTIVPFFLRRGDLPKDGGHLSSAGMWHAWEVRARQLDLSSAPFAVLARKQRLNTMPLRCVLAWDWSKVLRTACAQLHLQPDSVTGLVATLVDILCGVVDEFVVSCPQRTRFLGRYGRVPYPPPLPAAGGPILYKLRADETARTLLQCPITMGPMRHPRVTPAGHVFDGPAIGAWLESSDQCPMTRHKLLKEDLTDCVLLTVLCNALFDELDKDEGAPRDICIPPSAAVGFYCSASGQLLRHPVVARKGGYVYEEGFAPPDTPTMHVPQLEQLLACCIYMTGPDRSKDQAKDQAQPDSQKKARTHFAQPRKKLVDLMFAPPNNHDMAAKTVGTTGRKRKAPAKDEGGKTRGARVVEKEAEEAEVVNLYVVSISDDDDDDYM